MTQHTVLHLVIWFVPPIPLMFTFQGVNLPPKLDLLLDMLYEQQLSIAII